MSEARLEHNRANGMRALLVGVLGVRAQGSATSPVESQVGQTLDAVSNAMLDMVSKFVKDHPDKYPDRNNMLSMVKRGWLTIIEGGDNCEENVINFVEQVNKLEDAISAKKKT